MKLLLGRLYYLHSNKLNPLVCTSNDSSKIIRTCFTLANDKNYYLNKRIILTSLRLFTASANKLDKEKSDGKILNSSIVESNEKHGGQLSTHLSGTKKVKQAAADFSYGIVILCGALITFALFYYLFTELFSRDNPRGIYDESSKMCLDNFEVRDALGTPIKVAAGAGGTRIFQIKHKYYVEDGEMYLIINYYLQGPKNNATVYCKLIKDKTSGKLEYEHVIVKLDYAHRGQRNIIVKSKDEDSKKKF